MNLDRFYMQIAKLTSLNSKANRNKVGCIIVKNSNIISFGWNGTPHGFNNCCEDKENKTKPEVIHAEMNAICKLAKNGISSMNSTIYITLSPCYDCGKMLIQSGIKKVVYLQEYRDKKPLRMLKKAGVTIKKFEERL